MSSATLNKQDRRSNTRKQAFLSLARVPALSPTATQLLGRLARRHCEVHELAVLIERDPLLSAQILAIANSAAFGRAQPISSIQHAIAMIGLGAVRKFALARSISNLFGKRKIAPSFSMTRFNLHSVATGMFLELLSEMVPLEDAEDAFLAGLFHDVGKLVIAVAMPEQYENILRDGRFDLRTDPRDRAPCAPVRSCGTVGAGGGLLGPG